MTTITRALCILLLHLGIQLSYGQSSNVIIEFKTTDLVPDRYKIYYFKTNQLDDEGTTTTVVPTAHPTEGILRWEFYTPIPVVLSATAQFAFDNGSMPLEPGDSVRITETDQGLRFSGLAANKFELSYKLSQVVSPKVNKMLASRYLYADSLRDFNTYFRISESRLHAELALLEQYRPKLSHLTAQYMRGYYMNGFRNKVASKFERTVFSRRKFNVPIEYFRPLYDSTLAKYWPSAADSSDIVSLSTRTATALKKYVTTTVNFEQILAGTYDGGAQERLYKLYYERAKRSYQGLAQRKALSYLLRSLLDDELTPTAVALSEDFLSLSGYDQYRDYINRRLSVARRFEKGSMAPPFSLTTLSGKQVTAEDLRGKIVIMDFWFTGCVGCIQMTPAMRQTEAAFRNNKKVVFLNISVDKEREQWVNSVALKRYTTGSGLITYTGGQGASHKIIDDYDVSSYPSVFIIDADGRIVRVNQDPRHDSGQSLIRQIKDMLPVPPNDGPYVLYKAGEIVLKSVVEQKGIPVVQVTKQPQEQTAPLTFRIADVYSGDSFSVELQKNLSIPPASYGATEKILALSDIEGNLDAFTKLLKGNGVIDDRCNWTFGNGHLVLLGDFFDRGNQVTEVLWLAYSLEAKARQQGGWVHFILGNHEMMNMKGQLGYVQRKYKQNAGLLKEDYVLSLYGSQSELGRWLRTKNIVERVGNILFTHGGISAPINQLGLTLEQINDIARSQIGKSIDTLQPPAVQLLTSTTTAPFWYRGYYRGAKLAPQLQIDSTLAIYNVDKIVTGHTIIDRGESVTLHYEGKVINVDTHHAAGHSAALLLEGGRLYAVDVLNRKKVLSSTPTIKLSIID